MSKSLTSGVSTARTFFPFLLLALIAAVSACGDDDPANSDSTHKVDNDTGNADPTRGTVVFLAMEGGFYGIVGDDGARWDPVGFPDSLEVDSLRVSFHGEPADLASSHMWGQPLRLSEIHKIGDPPPINLEPFRELARNASCADIRNRLFLIDRQLVFWDQESRCADAAYSYTLYGRTVLHRLCNSMDSIAGPRSGCVSAGPYAGLFGIIVQHLGEPDLGLGAGHTVEPVDF